LRPSLFFSFVAVHVGAVCNALGWIAVLILLGSLLSQWRLEIGIVPA
jgi:hypothetical protein